MLWALSDGRALPAGELASAGGVRLNVASAHLAKLVAASFLSVQRHGRHRYYRISDPAIVTVLEALAVIAPSMPARSGKAAHLGRTVRIARTCYDHLAGTLGVTLTTALVERGALQPGLQSFALTPVGTSILSSIGIPVGAVVDDARRTRRPLTRACLDWSERRYHLAGALGAALASHLIDHKWVARIDGSRALRITNEGRRLLYRHFEVRVE